MLTLAGRMVDRHPSFEWKKEDIKEQEPLILMMSNQELNALDDSHGDWE